MVQLELGQEFYDRAFGEGVITTEEEAKAKIKEQLEIRNNNISDAIFTLDFYKKVDEKYASQLNLADDLILATHEFTTEKRSQKQKKEKRSF